MSANLEPTDAEDIGQSNHLLIKALHEGLAMSVVEDDRVREFSLCPGLLID